MEMVSSLEEQLQVRTSKLATLEKVLGNTRRHLQDAVENVRETELHYQTKIEELEHDYEEERVELQDKIHKVYPYVHLSETWFPLNVSVLATNRSCLLV